MSRISQDEDYSNSADSSPENRGEDIFRDKDVSLWIVSTPIGNIGDISARALQAIEKADLVIAEDTRKSGILFKLLELPKKSFVSLNDFNEPKKFQAIINRLLTGTKAVLVSDAGTPLISDPGFLLIKECNERGIKVSAVPGACSPIAALSVSGFPPIPFAFLGFLPRKAGDVRELFRRFKDCGATLIYFERKNRIAATLQWAFEELGARRYCIARELTKRFEELIFGNLQEQGSISLDLQGEITVVISPAVESGKTGLDGIDGIVRDHAHLNMPKKELARKISACVSGWSAKEVYNYLLSLD